MGLGVSLILIAVGAVLHLGGARPQLELVDVNTIGVILLDRRAVGALLSMIFWSSWAGPGYFARSRRTYVDEGL